MKKAKESAYGAGKAAMKKKMQEYYEPIIQDHLDTVAAYSKRIDGLNGDVSSRDNRITQLEKDIEWYKGKVAQWQGQKSGADNMISEYSARIDGLNGKVGGLEKEVKQLKADIEWYKAKVAQWQGQKSGADDLISKYSARIDGLNADVSSRDKTIAQLQKDVEWYKGKVEQWQGQKSGADSMITDYSARIDGLNADVAGLTKDLAAANKLIDFHTDRLDKVAEIFKMDADNFYSETGVLQAIKDAKYGSEKWAQARHNLYANADDLTDYEAMQRLVEWRTSHYAAAITFVAEQNIANSLDNTVTHGEYTALDSSVGIHTQYNTITVELTDGTKKVIGINTWGASNLTSITSYNDESVAGTRTITESGDYLLTFANGRKYKLEINVDALANTNNSTTALSNDELTVTGDNAGTYWSDAAYQSERNLTNTYGIQLVNIQNELGVSNATHAIVKIQALKAVDNTSYATEQAAYDAGFDAVTLDDIAARVTGMQEANLVVALTLADQLRNKISAADDVSSEATYSGSDNVYNPSGYFNQDSASLGTFAVLKTGETVHNEATSLYYHSFATAGLSGTEIANIKAMLKSSYRTGYDDGFNAGYTQGYADGVNAVQAKLD